MARSAGSRGPRESRESEHEREYEHRRERDGDDDDEGGDDPRRHDMILQRRWLGSPPPTAERYASALRQWQALPGAVVRPASTAAEPSAPTTAGSASGKTGNQP